MARITYDDRAMKCMSLFETITKTQLKDCIIDNIVLFIVQEGQIGKAVGKKGANVRALERALKTRVKIVEWNPELVRFVQNLIYPAKLKGITEEDGVVVMDPVDLKTRGMLIGRNASTLRNYEAIVQRYFDVKELKVV